MTLFSKIHMVGRTIFMLILSHTGNFLTQWWFWKDLSKATQNSVGAQYWSIKAPDSFFILHKIIFSTRGNVLSVTWLWWKHWWSPTSCNYFLWRCTVQQLEKNILFSWCSIIEYLTKQKCIDVVFLILNAT